MLINLIIWGPLVGAALFACRYPRPIDDGTNIPTGWLPLDTAERRAHENEQP
ncbi:MAG: hypothetical protein WBA38_04265 [Gordonia sp. (in: high G+C Gram-positive bacteria)]|uniref:hypothetical protein n=1 Tax=Gordonia sp. (in: high G+C Gram-positive bacteria) TaxID=84139 RepID=UPI003C77F5D0